MHVGSKDVISFASRIVIIIAVINGLMIPVSFVSGNALGGLVLGVMLWLELWVFFKLLHSHEAVIVEVLEHDKRIEKLEQEVLRLEDVLKEGKKEPNDTKQEKKKSIPLKPLEQKIKPEPEQPPKEGFVQCSNPYCREIQMDNRELCWKCGTKLKP